MYQAFVRGDHATFVGYMHPKITEMMGGREKTLETIKKALAAAKSQGLTPSNATAAPVQQFVEVAPSKLQVIIPADVIMKGKDWRFVSGPSCSGFRPTAARPGSSSTRGRAAPTRFERSSPSAAPP